MIRNLFGILSFLLYAQVGMTQKAEMISLDRLQNIIQSKDESVQIINFWATWCAPCVKEIPYFEKLTRERKDVKVTLVSMDIDLDPNPEKIYRFIARKNIQSRVVILNEPDPNSWITKIDKHWSGSLPATLLVNTLTGKRKFVDHELHDGELEKWIDELK